MAGPLTELVFGPFVNWFNTKCADIWSSPVYFEQEDVKKRLSTNGLFGGDIVSLYVYGAKNYLMLCQIDGQNIRFVEAVKAFRGSNTTDTGNVTTVAFSKNVRFPILFAGSRDGQILAYDCSTKKRYTPNHHLHKPSKKITCADWACARNVLYSSDKAVFQWDLKTGECGQIFAGSCQITSFAISKVPPYNLAVGLENGDVAVMRLKSSIKANESELVELFKGLGSEICSVAFPWDNGQYSRGIVAAASREGAVGVWDLSSRNSVLKVIELDKLKGVRNTLNSKDFNFFSVAFVPVELDAEEKDVKDERNRTKEEELSVDNFSLLVSNAKGHIKRFLIPKVPQVRGADVNMSNREESWLTESKLSHNGVVFSISILGRFGGGPSEAKMLRGGGGWLSGKFAHRELPKLAVSISYDKQAIVWDLRTRKPVSSFKMLSHQVRAIEFNYFNAELPGLAAAVGGEGIRMFNFDSVRGASNGQRVINSDIYHSDLHFLHSKKLALTAISWNAVSCHELAIGTYTGDVFVYDVRKRFHKQSILYAHTESKKRPRDSKIYSLVWGPCPSEVGERTLSAIYSVSSDKKLTVHLPSKRRAFNFNDITDGQGSKSGKTEVSWRDDWTFAAIGYDSGLVEIYHCDLKSCQPLKLIVSINCHTQLINCLKWHPINVASHSDELNESSEDGSTFTDKKSQFAGWLAVCSDGVDVTLHDLSDFLGVENSCNQVNVPTKVLTGHTKRVTSMSWSLLQEGLLASVSCNEVVVRVWNISLKEPCVSLFKGHWADMFSVAWCPFDEDLIVSGGSDGTVQLWRPSANPSNVGLDGPSEANLNEVHSVFENGMSLEADEDESVAKFEQQFEQFKIFMESIAVYSMTKELDSRRRQLEDMTNAVDSSTKSLTSNGNLDH